MKNISVPKHPRSKEDCQTCRPDPYSFNLLLWIKGDDRCNREGGAFRKTMPVASPNQWIINNEQRPSNPLCRYISRKGHVMKTRLVSIGNSRGVRCPNRLSCKPLNGGSGSSGARTGPSSYLGERSARRVVRCRKNHAPAWVRYTAGSDYAHLF